MLLILFTCMLRSKIIGWFYLNVNITQIGHLFTAVKLSFVLLTCLGHQQYVTWWFVALRRW